MKKSTKSEERQAFTCKGKRIYLHGGLFATFLNKKIAIDTCLKFNIGYNIARRAWMVTLQHLAADKRMEKIGLQNEP